MAATMTRVTALLGLLVLVSPAPAATLYPLPAIPGNPGIVELQGDATRLRALDHAGRVWMLDPARAGWTMRPRTPVLVSLAGSGDILFGLSADGRAWRLRPTGAVAVRIPVPVRLIRADRKGLLYMVATDGSIWQAAEGAAQRIGAPSPVRALEADGEVVAMLEDGRLFRWSGGTRWQWIGGRPSTRQMRVDLGTIVTLEEDGTIWRHDGISWSTVRVRSTARDIALKDGVLYTVGGLGVHRLVDGDWKALAGPDLPAGRLVALDRSTVAWVSPGGRLALLDPRTPPLGPEEALRRVLIAGTLTVTDSVELAWLGGRAFPAFRHTVR